MTENLSKSLIDSEAVKAAVKWTLDAQERGDRFIKEFGVQNIIEAYENAKGLHLVRTTLSDEVAADVLGEYLVILKNGHVHVTRTIRALHDAGFNIVRRS